MGMIECPSQQVILFMTREEKLQIIKDRLGKPAASFTPFHVSMLIIIGYLETLRVNGIIADGEVETTSIGKDALSICQEFDWKPSDPEIVSFCKDMVSSEQLTPFVIMLRQMRDNPTEFLENAKKHIKDQNEEE